MRVEAPTKGIFYFRIENFSILKNLPHSLPLLIVSILLFTAAGCTTKTKIIYFDSDQNQISKSRFFESRDFRYNIDVYYETDTTRVGLLVNRRKFGKFSKDEFDLFKSQLASSLDTQITFDKPVIINYFFDIGNGEDCVNNVYPLPYTVKLEEMFPQYHSIYVVNKDYGYKTKFNKIKTDKFDLIRTVFIKHKIRCLNYIGIKPNGSYAYCYGDGCEMNYMMAGEWPKI